MEGGELPSVPPTSTGWMPSLPMPVWMQEAIKSVWWAQVYMRGAGTNLAQVQRPDAVLASVCFRVYSRCDWAYVQ